MKKLIVLWVILLTTSISCSPDKSQSQTIQGQTPATETQNIGEYETKILDRAETFYNNRMTQILWIMGFGVAIVGIIVPILLELQRQRNFKKEMANRLQEFKEYTKKQTQEVETKLISQIDDRETEQTTAIASNLSVIFTEIGALFLAMKEWNGMLLSFSLAIKRSVSGQCIRNCIDTCNVRYKLEKPHIAKEIDLCILEGVDEALEEVKECLHKIADAEERTYVESQARDLQILVHALIKEKQQAAKTTPPQAGPQQS